MVLEQMGQEKDGVQEKDVVQEKDGGQGPVSTGCCVKPAYV
jgi:hypothetical protein